MRRRPRYYKRETEPKVPINERIRAPMLRVVIEDSGEALGVITRDAALKAARVEGLDLVEVASSADPPVAKIMDYGRYAFQQKKKTQESKKKQKQIQVKEVKFRPRIDQHDYEFKKKHMIRFLEGGDKVKATIQFRGREMTRIELGRKVVRRLVEELNGIGILESNPSMMGNRMHAIFAPDKKAVARAKKQSEAEEAAAEVTPVEATPALPAPPAKAAEEAPVEATEAKKAENQAEDEK